MFTLTASLQNAISLAGAQPRWLAEFDTLWGVKRYATEPLRWSGFDYEARLAAEPTVTTGLGTAGMNGPRTVSLVLADADGYFAQKRPEFFRNRGVTLKRIFLDVESDALGTWQFIVTGLSLPRSGPGGAIPRFSRPPLSADFGHPGG
jgi:hypothetical protein